MNAPNKRLQLRANKYYMKNQNRTIRRFLILVCLYLVSCTTEQRPEGNNCGMINPPSNAGEDSHMYFGLAKVYPRAKNMSAEYSGCQIIWSNKGESLDSWSLAFKLIYANGELVRSQTFLSTDSEALECKYNSIELVSGKADDCYPLEQTPVVSMRPGCLKDLVEASYDRTKPLPTDCQEYE